MIKLLQQWFVLIFDEDVGKTLLKNGNASHVKNIKQVENGCLIRCNYHQNTLP